MMNLSTLKTLFLTTVFMLFGCLAIQAQVFIYPTKGLNIEIKLDEAGTLPDRIEHIKDDISELKIIGEINGTDLDVIREMAGGINQGGYQTDGILSVLDLSEARIVKGGHYFILSSNYSTSKDKIGEYVFYGCSSLTSITLPPHVTEIGNSAFYGCRGLTSLTLPSGVTKIGNSAFSGCRGLTSLTLPSGVTKIGSSAFEGCIGLTSLTIPSDVTEIGSSAFENCSNIASLTIPLGVAKIGDSAFSDCSRLTSLTIPSSVKSLGDYAFQKCSSLQSIYVSWSIPISVGKTFYAVDKSKCTLYVPQGTKHDYLLADVWGDFWNIIEYNPTGIDKVTTSNDAKELSRYSVNGQRLSAPAKGLNIVKYSDGSVKKVVVQ